VAGPGDAGKVKESDCVHAGEQVFAGTKAIVEPIKQRQQRAGKVVWPAL